jgi:hypothetical protein
MTTAQQVIDGLEDVKEYVHPRAGDIARLERAIAFLRALPSASPSMLDDMPTDAEVKAICEYRGLDYGDKLDRADSSELWRVIRRASRSHVPTSDQGKLDNSFDSSRPPSERKPLDAEYVRQIAKEAYCADAEFDKRWTDGDFRTFCKALVFLATNHSARSSSGEPYWLVKFDGKAQAAYPRKVQAEVYGSGFSHADKVEIIEGRFVVSASALKDAERFKKLQQYGGTTTIEHDGCKEVRLTLWWLDYGGGPISHENWIESFDRAVQMSATDGRKA